MDKNFIQKLSNKFVKDSPYNYISKEKALREDLQGLKLFKNPLIAYGSVEDKLFEALREDGAVGRDHMMPKDWLEDGKTIVSFFFPFTNKVKISNRKDYNWPSEEWLHGRIEGQVFVNEFSKYISQEIIKSGYKSLAPSLDPRFAKEKFTSNWSERHVAYLCGNGSFGLSKGIITEKGMAGRLTSLVTNLKLEPSERKYSQIYEYCSNCGGCVRNCPADAISLKTGKDHVKCSEYLDKLAEKYEPYYGCGKCQCGVLCESRVGI